MTSNNIVSDMIISYSENREDVIIDAFFEGKSDGYYVDIGSGHPVHNSVTRLCYLKGWHGIDIERDGRLVALTRADRPRDVVLTVDAVSSHARTGVKSTCPVPGPYSLTGDGTLADVLSSVGSVKKIDFMRINDEDPYKVILGNDWQGFRPELVCIRASAPKDSLQKFMLSVGYIKIFYDGLNEYYSLRESKRGEAFSFSSSVLARYPKIIPYVPHTQRFAVNEGMFLYKRDDDDSLDDDMREILTGAVSVVDNTFRTILTRRIIELKRGHLERKVRDSIKRGDNGRVGSLNYFTPKLFALRIALYTEALAFRIIRIIGIRRFVK